MLRQAGKKLASPLRQAVLTLELLSGFVSRDAQKKQGNTKRKECQKYFWATNSHFATNEARSDGSLLLTIWAPN